MNGKLIDLPFIAVGFNQRITSKSLLALAKSDV
ncbi:hypothetical protein SAMN05421821_105220 [Mucilaginibacter lappiensis]|uniref:Uncharacterized protein n=1 Tax=Mucilaginibacter lappiensis TaxID=354630 RepID=A0ABR6PJ38_9SPHI|nr:hypothetical protein [Mucilaginibacter lappiensis]SIR16038.1 hypothetical protein SAMN05421821_105220 [Mucilaginibacter lappiensis]